MINQKNYPFALYSLKPQLRYAACDRELFFYQRNIYTYSLYEKYPIAAGISIDRPPFQALPVGLDSMVCKRPIRLPSTCMCTNSEETRHCSADRKCTMALYPLFKEKRHTDGACTHFTCFAFICTCLLLQFLRECAHFQSSYSVGETASSEHYIEPTLFRKVILLVDKAAWSFAYIHADHSALCC